MAMWFVVLALLLLLPMVLSVWAVLVSHAAKKQSQHDRQQLALLQQRIAVLTQQKHIPPADAVPPPIPVASQPLESNTQQAPIEPDWMTAPPLPTTAAPELPSTSYGEPSVAPDRTSDTQSVSVVTSIWQSFLHWFNGGNAIVRVGMLVLLVGVVLLLRLAVDVFTVSIELRLGLVAAGGVALTLLGIKLRKIRYSYAMSLQGGGLAVVYLTLFAAYRLYAVLPSGLTFSLLAVLAVISAGLALLQNALPLALLAFGAAFLAPLLTATGSNQVVALFAYYLLLNAALAWLAHYRTWKVLNVLGAMMTFGLAGYWGLTAYDASQRWQLELLLLAHMALYLFMAVRYSQQLAMRLRQKNEAKQVERPQQIAGVGVDSTLLFGVPLMGFSLQAGLLHDVPMLLALSSAVLSAVYLALAYYLIQRNPALKLLTEGILALGVAFMALVIPLALNLQWTVVGWSVQGAALVWLGVRQQRIWTMRFGVLLQVMSFGLLVGLSLPISAVLLPLFIVAVCLLCSAYLVRCDVMIERISQTVRRGSFVLLLLAVAVSGMWCEYVLLLLLAHTGESFVAMYTGLSLLFIAVLGVMVLARVRWLELLCLLRLVAALLSVQVAVMWVCMLWGVQASALLWLFSVAYGVLGVLGLRQLQREQRNQRLDQALWCLGVLLLVSMLGAVYGGQPDWLLVAVLPVVWVFALLYLPILKTFLQTKPLLQDITPVLGVLAGGWVLLVNWHVDGQLWGLPYVPLLNALDLLIMAMVFSLLMLRQYVSQQVYRLVRVGLAVAVFWWITGMLIRGLHQWLATPLWGDGAWHSGVVHSALTLLWTLLALVLTGVASRFAWRDVWLAGGVLLVVVVLKLLLVDLSNAATMARILSFIGAGLIMLLIGYVAPLPPSAEPKNSP